MSTRTFVFPALAVFLLGLAGCESTPEGVQKEAVADMVYQVLRADRTVYAQKVVTRLQDEEQVIEASEHWVDDKALPLPAQMFRMGAELVAENGDRVSYALLSRWPINKKNAPKTKAEEEGLKAIRESDTERYYTEETLGGKDFFTAVYPDVAVAPACIDCHNSHQDSPRSDFELGDVMGGVVVRIALD